MSVRSALAPAPAEPTIGELAATVATLTMRVTALVAEIDALKPPKRPDPLSG
jgi:hypothetical protein